MLGTLQLALSAAAWTPRLLRLPTEGTSPWGGSPDMAAVLEAGGVGGTVGCNGTVYGKALSTRSQHRGPAHHSHRLALRASQARFAQSGWLKGKRVLEVGCGTGLAACVCAAAGAQCVVATDKIIDAVGSNAAANGWCAP